MSNTLTQSSRIPLLSILPSVPAPGEDLEWLVSQELAAQRNREPDKDLEVSFQIERSADGRPTGYILLYTHKPEHEQSYQEEQWEKYAEDELAELYWFDPPPTRIYREVPIGQGNTTVSMLFSR